MSADSLPEHRRARQPGDALLKEWPAGSVFVLREHLVSGSMEKSLWRFTWEDAAPVIMEVEETLDLRWELIPFLADFAGGREGISEAMVSIEGRMFAVWQRDNSGIPQGTAVEPLPEEVAIFTAWDLDPWTVLRQLSASVRQERRKAEDAVYYLRDAQRVLGA